MLLQQLLIDAANRTPDKVVLHWVNRNRSLTAAEAVTQMDRVAGGLANLGVERGDRVAVFAHNGMDYVLAMFGTWRLGAIAALISVQYAESLDYFINDCHPKVLIYTGDHFETIARHRPNLLGVQHYVCLDGPQDGALGWQDLMTGAPVPPPDRTNEEDVAHLSYTSGTSGKPKGVCLAHEPTLRATRCIAERLRLGDDDCSLGPTSLSSSYHLVANLLPGLHAGASVQLLTGWEADSGWQAADQTLATVLAANPLILRDILEVSRRRGRPPKALRIGLSGGGPVPPDLKLAWRDELRIPLVESYGQSELGGFVALGYPEPTPDDMTRAVGKPLPDKEVRIFDEEDREVPIEEVGEIVLRGGFMAGYWERPEATSQTLRGGWLHTGDAGYMDPKGYIFFRGRLSERLRVAGEYWYPRDIEELLMLHPAIKDAAVIGLPDAVIEQKPKAYVTLRGTLPLDVDELRRSAERALSRDLHHLEISVLDAMPMTPTGKISKAQLVAREASVS